MYGTPDSTADASYPAAVVQVAGEVPMAEVPQYTSYPATPLPTGSLAPLQVKFGSLHVFCHTSPAAAQPGLADVGLPGSVASYLKVNNIVQLDPLPALSWDY